MKTRVTAWMIVWGLAFGAGALTSSAQDAGKDKPVEKAKEKAKDMAKEKLDSMKPGGKPSEEEMKKMTEEMAKMAAPGPEHEHFKTLVGKWDVTSTFTMPGSESAQHSTGSAEYKLILDGRFVVEDLHMIGEKDKQPFSGYGTTGFDKNKGKYVGTWMDSMGTSIGTFEGTMDPSGKKMTGAFEMYDCMAKGMKKNKMTEETVSDDKRVMKMYDTVEGKEVLALEVTYTRKK